MRLYRLMLWFVSTSLTIGTPAADSDLQTLPQCAVDCKQQVLTTNPTLHATTNTADLCGNVQYQNALKGCVSANCTVREALTAQRLNSRQCDLPVHEGNPVVDPATMAPMILGTLFYAIRILSKSLGLGGGWWWDDLTISIAWALAIVVYSLNASMIHYGFGRDMWTILPMDNITRAFIRFYAYVLVYKVQISLAKISVCLFLLRIFQFRAFYYITYVVIGINACIGISWVFADAFQCDPVHLAWTGWEQAEKGTCIDFNTSTVINAFVNIAVDATMVVMPVYEVMKLNMSKSKRLGVALMFAVGLVVIVVAILRVVVLYKFSHWDSSTAQLGPVVHWSTIECQVTIVCACMPMTRQLLVRCFPRLVGGSTQQSHPYKATPSGRTGFGGGTSNSNQIAKTVSYSVNYATPRRGSNGSDVELVGVPPNGKT